MLKVVSHTPIECEKLTAARKAGNWIDTMRVLTPRAGEALHVVELPRDGQLAHADRGRRLDHVWTSRRARRRVSTIKIAKEYRGCERPSDHVPVTATLELD